MSKPHFFTKKETVSGKVSVWATPACKADILDGKPPFEYSLDTRNAYWMGDNQTCVMTEDVELQIPAGIDLLAKTIETLKKKKEEVQAAAYKQQIDIQEQINSLLTLTYQPDPITHNDPTIMPADEEYGADTIIERANNDFVDDAPL